MLIHMLNWQDLCLCMVNSKEIEFNEIIEFNIKSITAIRALARRGIDLF